MNINMIMLFLFNFFLNSIAVFLVSCLLVELLIFIFRIKDFRAIYFARCIPFIKIFLDLVIYNFSSWALLNNINPLISEIGSRTLTVQFSSIYFIPLLKIFCHLPDGLTFTFTDIFAMLLGQSYVLYFILIFISFSLFGQYRFIKIYRKNKYKNRMILDDINYIELPVKDEKLLKIAKKKNISYGISSYLSSPCVIKKNIGWTIAFPCNFQSFLNQDEIKAIIYHEMQHIHFFDYYFAIFFSFLLSILSFNPLLFYWQNKLNFTKECACDQKIRTKYIHLATALKKFSTLRLTKQQLAFANKNTILKRIKCLSISNATKGKNPFKYIKLGLLTIGLLGILISKVLIF